MRDEPVKPERAAVLVLRAWFTTSGRVVWQRALAIMVMVCLLALLAAGVQVMSGTSSPWTIAALIGIAGVLVVAAAAILKRLSRNPAQHDVELILSAHELTAQPRRGTPTHAPWRSFGAVEMGRDLGGLRLLSLKPPPRRWLISGGVSFIIDAAQVDAEALRRQIERLIAEPGNCGGSPVDGTGRRLGLLIFA
jgi:hypothetical protein